MIKKLFIQVADSSINLETELFLPENAKSELAVILTHPHPQFGGSMWNNVTNSLFSTFSKENFPVLRFNFRGIGRSTGSYGRDKGEQEDVRACLSYLVKDEGFNKIVIIGYSYGAAIGCSIVNESENIIGYVAIAFPFDLFKKFKELAQSTKPKLFIQGDRDDIASYYAFPDHFEDLNPPKEKKIIANCDHFYIGYESTASKCALDFVKMLKA